MPSTEESGDSSSETSESSMGNKGGRKAEPKGSKRQGGKRAASASKVKPKPPAKKQEKKTPAPARMPPNTPMVKQLAKTPVKRGRDATDADAPNPEIPPVTPPPREKTDNSAPARSAVVAGIEAQQQVVIPLPASPPKENEDKDRGSVTKILTRMNGANTPVEKLMWVATQCAADSKTCGAAKKKGSVLIHDGKEVHIVCKVCGWVTHSDTFNNYYTHMRSPKEGVPSPCAQKLATTKEKEKSKAKEQNQTELTTEEARKYKDAFALFMRKTVPILCVQAGMSHGAATKFLVNYEEHRPIMGPLKAAKLVTRTHVTWNAHEKALAADLWKIIRDEVGKCRIFGVAIDAAVDRVLARFILIIVMYVGSLAWQASCMAVYTMPWRVLGR